MDLDEFTALLEQKVSDFNREYRSLHEVNPEAFKLRLP